MITVILFLSTSSARRTTPRASPSMAMEMISIHVLREEDDIWAMFYDRPA